MVEEIQRLQRLLDTAAIAVPREPSVKDLPKIIEVRLSISLPSPGLSSSFLP